MHDKSNRQPIFINARFLTQPVTGVQRYAEELVKALDNLIEQGEINCSRYRFELLTPRRGILRQLNLRHIPLRKVGRLTGHAWEQLELPFYCRGGPLLNLCNTAPLLKAWQIATVHDAAVFGFPRAYSLVFRAWYRILLRGLARRARQAITVSSFSKQELMHYCGFATERLQVIYEGAGHVVSTKAETAVLNKHNLQVKPFILAVSSLSPHKNFISVIQAIQSLGQVDFEFAIVGGVNPKVFSKSSMQFPDKSPAIPDNVKYIGYVTDGELRALYENAACFIFPSFYEGFGLPPVEAMACGCPVIAAKAASLPEVCGDAALYCDPANPRDIADKIRLLMSDPQLRADIRQKGLQRAAGLTWQKCAAETFKVIQGVLL